MMRMFVRVNMCKKDRSKKTPFVFDCMMGGTSRNKTESNCDEEHVDGHGPFDFLLLKSCVLLGIASEELKIESDVLQ